MLWLKLSHHYRVYSVTSVETSFSAILVGLGKLAGYLCSVPPKDSDKSSELL